jgi:integrase/recombinase XerD
MPSRLLVAKHANAAEPWCPSLRTQKISAHVLRYTAAMRLLHAGVDTSVIALFLGHEAVASTRISCTLNWPSRASARSDRPAPTLHRGHYRTPRMFAFLRACDNGDNSSLVAAKLGSPRPLLHIIRPST